jgi:hypothetical protein
MSDLPVRPRREYDLDARMVRATARLRAMSKLGDAFCFGVDSDGYMIGFATSRARRDALESPKGVLGRSHRRLPIGPVGYPTLPSPPPPPSTQALPALPPRAMDLALAPLFHLMDLARTENPQACLGVDPAGFLVLFASAEGRDGVFGLEELGRAPLPIAMVGQ